MDFLKLRVAKVIPESYETRGNVRSLELLVLVSDRISAHYLVDVAARNSLVAHLLSPLLRCSLEKVARILKSLLFPFLRSVRPKLARVPSYYS